MEYMIWRECVDDVNGRFRMVHLGINFGQATERKSLSLSPSLYVWESVVYCLDIYSMKRGDHFDTYCFCVLAGWLDRWRRMTELWLIQCDKVCEYDVL